MKTIDVPVSGNLRRRILAFCKKKHVSIDELVARALRRQIKGDAAEKLN